MRAFGARSQRGQRATPRALPVSPGSGSNPAQYRPRACPALRRLSPGRPLAPRQRSASVPPLNGLGTAQAPTRAKGPGLVLAAAAPPPPRRPRGAALGAGSLMGDARGAEEAAARERERERDWAREAGGGGQGEAPPPPAPFRWGAAAAAGAEQEPRSRRRRRGMWPAPAPSRAAS